MIYFALRHKPSGHLFPARGHRGNTSYAEFTDQLPPRLFKRRQDALFVARHWVEGHTFQTNAQRYDEHDSFLMTTLPVDGRRIEDLEIVKVLLTLQAIHAGEPC